MADFPALPLWTDAYLGDTTHLSLEEHGAYLKLLIIAWRSKDCCLYDDDVKLARMLGVTVDRWRRKLRPAIEPFWTVAEGRWTQKRLLKEREKVQNFSEVQRERAKKRWDPKSLNGQEPGDAGAVPVSGNPIPTPTPSPRKKDSSPPPSESPPCAQAREEPAPAGPVVATSSLFLIRSKERCSEAEANARWQRIVKAAEGNEGRAVVAVDVAYHHGPLGVPLTTYAIGVCRREIARVEALAKADFASTAHAAERQDRIYEAEMRVLYGDDWTMHKPGHA